MKFQNYFAISLLASTIFVSCSSDDDGGTEDSGLVIPSTYTFLNEEGESTVSFDGQTTRLQQGQEMLDLFETYGTTEATLDEMYAGIPDPSDPESTISSGFANEDLNGTSKLLRAKTAASDDYFDANTVEAAAIKMVFDGYISSQVDTFLSLASEEDVPTAEAGVAGKLVRTNDDGSTTTRIVNADGLEYKQAFNKGLIGAIMLDQIVNNYLSRALVEGTQEANTNDVLDEDNNYTLLEHYWDEAYGYVYGNTEDDSFLFNYIGRVDGDADFTGIADEIETAFITGRAAIVANDYDVVETQVALLQQLLSEVVAIRGIYYLQQGKNNLEELDAINNGSAFHNLSEGYGFVYSLRFTKNSATGDTYFSKETVDGYLAQLEAGDGFWDLIDNEGVILDEISDSIAAQFDFTTAAAAETTAE